MNDIEYNAELLLEQSGELIDKLLNPDYPIRDGEYGNGFGVVDEVTRIYRGWHELFPNKNLDDTIALLVEQMLLRLRSCSPHIYAITVGQFPEFDQLEEYWKTEGYKDIDDHIWLAPNPFGKYVDFKFRKG